MASIPYYAATVRRLLASAPGDLTTAERFVLTLLLLHADGSWRSSVTRARLAMLSGLSEGTVKRALGRLRERGALGEPELRRDREGRKHYHHPLLLREPDSADCSEPDPQFAIDRLQQAIDQVPF